MQNTSLPIFFNPYNIYDRRVMIDGNNGCVEGLPSSVR